MKEFFNNLVEFVKKYAKEDNEAEISSLNLAGDNLEVFVIKIRTLNYIHN